MTPEERLIDAVMYGVDGDDQSTEGLRASARMLVDEYVHSLADKIHESAWKRERSPEISERLKAEGMHTAANMITPGTPRER